MLYASALGLFTLVWIAILSLTVAGDVNHAIPYRITASAHAEGSIYTSTGWELSALLKYHFVPVLLMSVFSWFWGNVDSFYRITQPYASMFDPIDASTSLILIYPSANPVSAALTAAINGHGTVYSLCDSNSVVRYPTNFYRQSSDPDPG